MAGSPVSKGSPGQNGSPHSNERAGRGLKRKEAQSLDDIEPPFAPIKPKKPRRAKPSLPRAIQEVLRLQPRFEFDRDTWQLILRKKKWLERLDAAEREARYWKREIKNEVLAVVGLDYGDDYPEAMDNGVIVEFGLFQFRRVRGLELFDGFENENQVSIEYGQGVDPTEEVECTCLECQENAPFHV